MRQLEMQFHPSEKLLGAIPQTRMCVVDRDGNPTQS